MATKSLAALALLAALLAGGLALLATGCVGVAPALPPTAFALGTPEMRPEIFFAGTTTSSGVQENADGTPTRLFRVTGHGETLPDGRFRLDQTIVFEGHAPETRSWLVRRIDAHRYTATLTDADGEVTGEAYGNLFHLRYAMKSPPTGRLEQWLYLQPDGRTVLNEVTVRVLGLVVAHVAERITHEASDR